MKTKTTVVVAALAAIVAPCAALADSDGSSASINVTGYGTIAGTFTDDRQLAFRRGADDSKGAGHSGDFGDLTKFGVQADVHFQRDISVVGQVVAKRRIDGDTPGADKDLDMQVAWLYGQYQFSDSANVRIGRFASPTYLLSDSLNVTYAAPWLRAPVHLYGTNAMETLEGAEVNWRHSVGSLNLTAQALYGNGETRYYSAPLPTTTQINDHRTMGVNLVAEYGNWLARVGAVRANTPRFGENPSDTYTGIGLQYDDGTWLVMGEYARRRDSALVALGNQSPIKGDYSYLAVGRRFGKLMPLLMVSDAKHDVGIAPQVRSDSNFHSLAASIRYDIRTNVSFKAQWDRYSANDSIAFVNPRFGDDSKINVFSAGLDFVF